MGARNGGRSAACVSSLPRVAGKLLTFSLSVVVVRPFLEEVVMELKHPENPTQDLESAGFLQGLMLMLDSYKA